MNSSAKIDIDSKIKVEGNRERYKDLTESLRDRQKS